MKRTKKMQENGHRISGKTIIGIDPAKNKHQAVVLNPDGTTAGRSFSFRTNHTGFTETLPRRIRERIKVNTELVFAIEGSCALWQNLAFHLHEQGQEVVLISPLATYHARPSITGDFSRTDSKDAELIARLAQQLPGDARPQRPPAGPAPHGDLLRQAPQESPAPLCPFAFARRAALP